MVLRFMDREKNDHYYIEKIKTDLKFVIDHTNGKSTDEIESDELLIDSIMFRIIQISENNSKLSKQFVSSHKEVPWAAIKGMRNRIVHDYDGVNLSMIWGFLTTELDDLKKQIETILSKI